VRPTHSVTSGLSARRQFWIVLLTTAVLGLGASQLTARWLGFQTIAMTPYDYGAGAAPVRAFAASSSLGYYGLDWGAIATNTGWSIRRYDIPAGSPCEMEAGQELATNATASILVVSAFDLDEGFFSEFRCALVPLGRTFQDLRESQASWAFSKRALSRYPEYWLKQVFPTAGSSMGVLVGLRSKAQAWRRSGGPSDKAVLNGSQAQEKTERVCDWDQGKLLRNAATLNASAQGTHFYSGPKHQSLRRILDRARMRGRVVVVVLPVSPAYHRLVGDKSATEFETSLAGFERDFPTAQFVRLDRLKGLSDDCNFWDLVHLNVYGRAIATRELEQRLAAR